MGAGPPKSEEDLGKLRDLLAEMEDAVKDDILSGEVNDLVLSNLIEIVTYSKVTGRPLFASPLDEPAFYRRYFARWVEEGLEEKRKVEQAKVDPVKTPGTGA